MKWNFKKKLDWYAYLYFISILLIPFSSTLTESIREAIGLLAILSQFILPIWIAIEIYYDAKKNKMSRAWVLSALFGIIGPWSYYYYTPEAKKARKKEKKYLFGLGLSDLIIISIILIFVGVIILSFISITSYYQANGGGENLTNATSYGNIGNQNIKVGVMMRALEKDWTEGDSCKEYVKEVGTVDVCQSGCYYTENLRTLINNAEYYMELNLDNKTSEEVNRTYYYISYCLGKVVDIAINNSNISICGEFEDKVLNETCVKWYNEG